MFPRREPGAAARLARCADEPLPGSEGLRKTNLRIWWSSLDLARFVIVPALLAGVALSAGYIPARHILVGNPMKALSHE